MCVCVGRGVGAGGGGGHGAQSNFPTRDHQNIFNLILTHIFMVFLCVWLLFVFVCFLLLLFFIVVFFFFFFGGDVCFCHGRKGLP